MASKDSLVKIERFVEEQINKKNHSLTLIETRAGLRVNNFLIHAADGNWQLLNQNGKQVSVFKSKRMAVLSAALLTKHYAPNVGEISSIDERLNFLRNEKQFYEYKINASKKSKLFEDRLSRTEHELSIVYSQISELEKSVGLQ